MNALTRITSLIDSQKASAQNLIGVAFPKSTSRSYLVTVALAKNAGAYGEIIVGDKLFHCAVFGLDKAQASYATMVLDAVKDWKHTKIFARGRVLERHYNVVEVLKCYLNSLKTTDRKTHCHFVYRDLVFFQFGKEVDRHLIPCRMLQGFTREIVRDRVASPKDSMNALAVQQGSFWCPHFDPAAFHSIQGENRALLNRVDDGSKSSKILCENQLYLQMIKQ